MVKYGADTITAIFLSCLSKMGKLDIFGFIKHPLDNLLVASYIMFNFMSCAGGKKGRAKGGASGRGVRGVDYGLGIGYSAESTNTTSSPVPSRSAAVNSLKTGMMAQFKNNFVAASSNPQNQNQGMSNSSSAYANKRPALAGFVSGGSIGGDIYKTQPTSSFPPAMSGVNTPSSGENASQKNTERLLL